MVFIKSLIAATIFLGFWLWYVPFRWLDADASPITGWRLIPGGGLLLTGSLLTALCVLSFARIGRGTPAPMDPPKHLVETGPYRWVRNPMYLGLGLLLLGEAILLGSVRILVLMAVLFALLHAFITWYEEPALERKFGDDYRAYRKRVHRWIPRRPGG